MIVLLACYQTRNVTEIYVPFAIMDNICYFYRNIIGSVTTMPVTLIPLRTLIRKWTTVFYICVIKRRNRQTCTYEYKRNFKDL